MFLLRGVAVSLSVFFLLYALLSLVVAKAWKAVALLIRFRSERQFADALFLARILPLAVASLTALLLIVPSFVLFEPRGSQEEIGVLPLLFGWAGLALLMFGMWNAIKALGRTAHVVRIWRAGAREVGCEEKVPVLCTNPVLHSGNKVHKEAPPFVVAGIVRPAVFMSPAAAAALSGPELESVIRHEMAHVYRRDNLKRLLFRACAFPLMQGVEHAWAEATEAAADDAAVSSTGEALDLAAALVKLSRLVSVNSVHSCSPGRTEPELTMALLHAGTTVPNRVERLVAWKKPQAGPAQPRRGSHLQALVGVGLFTLLYGPMLAGAHALTELLMH
jgi:Zn-dependent protease with chaperone function